MKAAKIFATPARLRLHRVARERKLTQAQIAELVDATQTAVSRWLDGTSRPDDVRRELLWKVFQIPRDEWRTAEETRGLLTKAAG